MEFRNKLASDIFERRYQHEGCETWEALAWKCATDVIGGAAKTKIGSVWSVEKWAGLRARAARAIASMKFIPGGRYLYYAGRPVHFWNNCYLLGAIEDTRQDWGELSHRVESCLMTGGGIGVDYSPYRASDQVLSRTGGLASGPIPKMYITNEQGRNVMQGGSRRSAIWAGLRHSHADIWKFLRVKNWHEIPIPGTDLTIQDAKAVDTNYPAPLDMTNISVGYDTAWLTHFMETGDIGAVFRENVRQAMMTGDPGFSFNFFEKEHETKRNACCEITSEDDSDVCNLGSINLSQIETLSEFREIVEIAQIFLLCGTICSDVPYEKVKQVRENNRRTGLGLMGVHEWLLKRGYNYSVPHELHNWLRAYKGESRTTADTFCDELSISRPVALRAIAPTGTIGILAATSTGIEPIFATAFLRRYLVNGTDWTEEYVIDGAAETIISECGLNAEDIETALDLANDPLRRIRTQAVIQDYVDHAISSTINLPKWGTDLNNEDKVDEFAGQIAHYAPRLRGLTIYPDAARGGQPLTRVDYNEARARMAPTESVDVCDITGKGGSCGS